jgi:DNA repair exonuclease SbcCD nuclease subunit
VQEAYGRAVDAILEREVDLVIHSGDVFDSVRPATHVIIGFLKQTSRITARAGIPYLVAAGNHETPRLRTTTAALEYANLVNVVSAHGFELDYEMIEVGDVGIGVALVPHGAVFGTGAVTPERGADVNILVTHGMVPGLEAKQHEMGEADLQSNMIDGGFDYVALGHYHEFHEHKPNAFYAGATERFGFGEVDSRTGFAIVEFDGGGLRSVEHVEIDARPMLDLPKISARRMDSSELSEAIRERTFGVDLDGAIVRLRAYDVRRGVASGIERELLRDLQRRCLNFSLEIHVEERPEDLERDGSPTAVFGPLGEEFASFVAARRERGELEAKFAEEFLEKGRGYLSRAASEEPGSAA